MTADPIATRLTPLSVPGPESLTPWAGLPAVHAMRLANAASVMLSACERDLAWDLGLRGSALTGVTGRSLRAARYASLRAFRELVDELAGGSEWQATTRDESARWE